MVPERDDRTQVLEEAREALVRAAGVLLSESESGDGTTAPDPRVDHLVSVVNDAMGLLASGKRPEVRAAVGEMLSTEEAAKELGVSRPHFVKLLEAGHLRFERTSERAGAHRRVSRTALEDYRRRRALSEAALREMSALSNQLG